MKFALKLASLSIALLALAGCATTSETASTTDQSPKPGPVSYEVVPVGITTGPYQPNEKSLEQHQAAPLWFQDAKFGIYVHWGPYTVPEFGSEWYPRFMFFEDMEPSKRFPLNFYQYHKQTYGDPKEFGYDKLIPLFTAEKFDADDWADLFKASGAQFAGIVAEHHDGFSMWDSDVNPWNAADMGPRKDIAGLMATAVRERDMKFILTFHHARNLQRYRGVHMDAARLRAEARGKPVQNAMWSSHYPWIEGYPTASDDPMLRRLYGNMPEREFLETKWLPELHEVIDKYRPDILWFDTWFDEIPIPYQHRFAADYLNRAEEWNKDVVITVKHLDLPRSIAVEDFEKGRAASIQEQPFLTDDTISLGSWSYTKTMDLKSMDRVMHDFIDIVSKNGSLLLNLSPRADGSIPQDQRNILLGMGSWLKANGEAIYGSRPWVMYGEGPNDIKSDNAGHFTEAVSYTADDIRFTTKGDALYAIALGTPKKDLLITALAEGSANYPAAIRKVTALSGDHVAKWSRTSKGLVITLKPGAPEQVAYAFKIEK